MSWRITPEYFGKVTVTLFALGWTPMVCAAGPPAIAVAASMSDAGSEIAAMFARETGHKVRLSVGASGNFVRQIVQGAPFELLLAADEDSIAMLAAKGLTRGPGAVYALGRIALFVPLNSPVSLDPELKGLADALQRGQVRRLAIANPEHAPYGRAARDALRRAGLWEMLEGRLALGENVAQAAQFAQTGAAEAGLIAYSSALAPALLTRGRSVLVREDWYAPIRQRMALLARAGPVAAAFYAYLLGPSARAAIERHGFALPPTL
jgi:molybdate transport system substrate-binding protein